MNKNKNKKIIKKIIKKNIEKTCLMNKNENIEKLKNKYHSMTDEQKQKYRKAKKDKKKRINKKHG